MLLYAIVTWEYAENKKWSKTVHFFWSSKIRTWWINSSTNTPVCFSWRCLCAHLGREVPQRQGHSHGCGFPFVCWSEGQRTRMDWKWKSDHQIIMETSLEKKTIKRVIAMPPEPKRVGPSFWRRKSSFKGTLLRGSMVNSLPKSMMIINAMG